MKKKYVVYDRSFDGWAEACLIALAHSEPPEGRAQWSARLPAVQGGGELGSVETVSHETVGKALKKRAPVASRQRLMIPTR